MLNRRTFARQFGVAIAAGMIAPGSALAQSQLEKTLPLFSVMMWALNKRGGFEENL